MYYILFGKELKGERTFMKNKKLRNKVKKALYVVPATATMLATNITPVYAGDMSIVTNAINKLVVLVCSAVAGIGAIVVAKGGMDLGTAIKDRDTSGIGTAAGEIFGGAIMCGIGGFLTYLGLK